MPEPEDDQPKPPAGENPTATQELTAEQLQQVNGGILIGLNQPAVPHLGGANVLMGDGSVRIQTPGVLKDSFPKLK